ncbi:MAG: hypothetical protein H6867_09845 [Rhodospirillales bacterium]|nr:hypothetical protein [Rhodospirillales bacterium]MCB9995915.1 hypothetical protein [Rhodospirillales bacterium]
MTSSGSASGSKLFWMIIALCLLPWFAIQSQLSLNGDAAWLMTATERLLAGEAMSEAYYEVNPPLSILYHIPPVLLGKFLPVPVYYIVFLYFAALIGLSALAVNAILKRLPFLETDQRFIMLAAYLAANTVFTSISLGERDHIVLLGLMPFTLLQLCLSWGYSLPRKVFWPVIICGVLAVLIKPHFGLLPVLFLLHRLFAQKRFVSIVKDPDFIALAAGTLSYVAFVLLFFRDFLTVILPDVLVLYVSNKNYEDALPELVMYTYMILIFMGTEAFLSPLKDRSRHFLTLLYAGGLFCLVPYAVQMKGFSYHLIPALGFFFCAFALSAQSYARSYLKNLKALTPALIIGIFALCYIGRPPLLAYPKHSDYPALPLSQQFDLCGPDCTYFIFNDSIEMAQPAALYDGKQNASRFPSFWFLPPLVRAQYALAHDQSSLLSAEQLAFYQDKYGQMIADDLEKYRPDMLLIGQYRMTEDEADFDFPGFFGTNEAFKAAWDSYEKADTPLTFNRRPYFAGTALDKDYPLAYDIYMKK